MFYKETLIRKKKGFLGIFFVFLGVIISQQISVFWSSDRLRFYNSCFVILSLFFIFMFSCVMLSMLFYSVAPAFNSL